MVLSTGSKRCCQLVMVVFHQKMSHGAHTHVLLAGFSAHLCWKAATLQKKPHSAAAFAKTKVLLSFIYFPCAQQML